MKPRTLPPSYASPDEFMRRVAETVNAIIQAMPDNGTTAQRPATPLEGQQYYDTTLQALIYWANSAWRWVGSGEAVP